MANHPLLLHHKKFQAAHWAAFIFYGGTKPQGFSSRGVSRSSLKTKGFLHIFTNSRKPCLWSRFIMLSLHCTCEAAPLVKLPPFGGRMCYLYSAALLLDFYPPWKSLRIWSILENPLRQSIRQAIFLTKNHIFLNFCSCISVFCMINYNQMERVLRFRKTIEV